MCLLVLIGMSVRFQIDTLDIIPLGSNNSLANPISTGPGQSVSVPSYAGKCSCQFIAASRQPALMKQGKKIGARRSYLVSQQIGNQSVERYRIVQ